MYTESHCVSKVQCFLFVFCVSHCLIVNFMLMVLPLSCLNLETVLMSDRRMLFMHSTLSLGCSVAPPQNVEFENVVIFWVFSSGSIMH